MLEIFFGKFFRAAGFFFEFFVWDTGILEKKL